MTATVGPAVGAPPPPRTPSGSEPVRASLRRRRAQETRTAYTLLIPSFIGVGVFLLLPMLVVLVLSFLDWNLISTPEFVGLENWVEIGSDAKFWNSLVTTLKFVAMTIPVSVVLGLLLAVALNQRMPGSSVFRVIYLLPWVSAPLALGVVWRWIFDPSNGLVNSLLGHRTEWLHSTATALPVVALVYIWSRVGYISLFYLAGLQSIPASVYEAARIDGANGFQTLLRMTVPLLNPTTFFILVTEIVASFQVFDLVYGLIGSANGYPGGSTDVIAARIYQEAFVSNDLGTASVMALILFAVLVVITVLQQRFFSGRLTYDMS